MKQQLLKKALFLFAVTLLSCQVSAQLTYTFDADLEGWPAGGNPPNGFATSIVWDAGSGANTGLAIIAPKEDPNSLGNTLTQNTIMYGPNNNTTGINTELYDTVTITLKNETIGTLLRIRCKNGAAAWQQQDFAISANDTAFQTYTFSLNSTQWNGTASKMGIAVRNTLGAWTTNTKVSVDKVEFFNSASFSGIVQNPSFEDLDGTIAPWSPATPAYAVAAVSSDEAHTGTYSLKHEYSATPTAGSHFVFTSYVHDIGFTTSDDIIASLWVKVVRPGAPAASPIITILGQARTGTSVGGTLALKQASKVSVKTSGTWEEIIFPAITPVDPYSAAQFRYGIKFTNLQAGDIVYVDDITANISSTLTVNENTLNTFSIYPNPVKNTLNIESQDTISNVAVYDVLGKEVISSNNVSNTLDVSALSNGVYLIKLTSDKGAATKRFIKE